MADSPLSLRPTSYPGWASGVSGYASMTEPTDLQKAIGWATGQAPPRGYMNWLQGLAYQWIQHLDRRVDIYYGDGSDGNATLMGGSYNNETIVGPLVEFSLGENYYHLLRDAHFENVKVGSGYALRPGRNRIFVNGVWDSQNIGNLGQPGLPINDGKVGGALQANGYPAGYDGIDRVGRPFGEFVRGPVGYGSSGGVGGGFYNQFLEAYNPSNTGTAGFPIGPAFGGAGGNGGSGASGIGGAGGSALGVTGATCGHFRAYSPQLLGALMGASGLFIPRGGAGGGGGGGGPSSFSSYSYGGAGGGGGGVIVGAIREMRLQSVGDVFAAGGAGGGGNVSGTGAGGGGGGGGGGFIGLFVGKLSVQTGLTGFTGPLNCPGGKGGGRGGTLGSTGATGQPGIAQVIRVW